MNQSQQKQFLELLEKTRYDQNAPPPVEQVVFRIQFKTIGSLGDFMIFSGRQKAGKSKFVSGAIAASISKETVFDMQIKLPPGKQKVAHFDTEQGKVDHDRMMKLIKQLAGIELLPDYFTSYRCRSLEGRHILSLVETYLQFNPECGMIYLDGLLDTIESMNDEKHSSFLKNWLKRITEQYNILLAGVIHRGFANDKSIGQIGSAADRAAQSVLKIEKNPDTKQYIMSSEYLRSADDISPVAIFYNKQLDLWEQTDYIDPATEGPQRNSAALKRKPYEYDIAEHTANTVRIFNTGTVQEYKNLLQRITEVYGVGQRWAKELVPILEREQLIFRTDTGFTNIRQGRLLKVE